ncbi:GFA family protein [Catenovulum sp. 2E275]|uniref:GFA family protein n=1 Tax=Catenovulum sp. 2E275 TaxID=2980497 RepID=UPI0021D2497C|nr:GFA family protein [Catenovulum sp. 2E275]MCU4674252.1 GFA family protein [Catenovulum sp. 2E275]
MYQGACLCGSVKFEIEGEFEHFYLCHCSYCRKDTGSAHAANLFSKFAKITWLSGESDLKVFRLEDTRHNKCFCQHCGSALPVQVNNSAMLVVPAGCLDSDIQLKPDANIFVGSKANWDNKLEQIKAFSGFPE